MDLMALLETLVSFMIVPLFVIAVVGVCLLFLILLDKRIFRP